MTNLWTAVTATGDLLITVIASDENQARTEIENQLRKPGRLPFLRKWEQDGKRVQPKS